MSPKVGDSARPVARPSAPDTSRPQPAPVAQKPATGTAPAKDSFQTTAPNTAQKANVLGATGTAAAAPTASAAGAATPAGATGGNPPIGAVGSGATYAPVQDPQLFASNPGDANPISPKDISQGAVGDCYFLSSLGTIAQHHPDLIKNAIHDNGNGTYTVTFHEKNDHPFFEFWEPDYKDVKITVNGDLPQKDGQTVFANTPNEGGKNETWVAIFEKAYAQYKGGYDQIKPGNGTYAMNLLTGKPTQQYGTGDLSPQQVGGWSQAGDGLTAVSLSDSQAKSNPDYQNGKLVSGHVYYVSNVDPKTGQVSLENPWGYTDPPIQLSWKDFQKDFGYLDHGELSK